MSCCASSPTDRPARVAIRTRGQGRRSGVLAEITSLVARAMEAARGAGRGGAHRSRRCDKRRGSVGDAADVNGHPCGKLSAPGVQRDGGQSHNDLRIDALSLNDYRNPPARSGANEGQRPSWFRRTFRRTS